MSEERADGWQVVYSNYYPPEVMGTFKTLEEAEEYVARFGGVAPWKVVPFYFDRAGNSDKPSSSEDSK